MVVVARVRHETAEVLDESIDESDESDTKPTAVSELIRRGELSNSVDLSGSITARKRRRETLPVSSSLLILGFLTFE